MAQCHSSTGLLYCDHLVNELGYKEAVIGIMEFIYETTGENYAMIADNVPVVRKSITQDYW